MDLAWRLVRACNGILSKAEIARDVGVGTTTIAKMRRRRREMIAAGQEPTGEWWRDAADKELEAPEEQDLAHEIAEHYERLKPHLRDLLRRPEDVQWGVLERLLGTQQLRQLVEWGIGDGDDICREDERDVKDITTQTTAPPLDNESDDF